jgi:hypothetical protein
LWSRFLGARKATDQFDAGVKEVRFASVACANSSRKLTRSCALGSRFLAVSLVEAIHPSSSVNQLLFSSKERVTGGANFDVQVALFR